MQIINWTKGTQTGSKKVHDFALTSTIANFRAAGYTIVEAAAPAPIATPAPAAEQTGRVGKGLAVHRIAAGHTVCGASYRRNSLGSTARQVRITGEAATCGNCR